MPRLKRSAPPTDTESPTSEPQADEESRSNSSRERRLALAMAQVDDAVERIRAREQAKEAVDGRVSTLTPKERTFLINHLAGETQVRAAEIAGYKQPEKQGWRLAHSPKIQAAMDEILTAQEMPKLKVVALLSQHADAAYAPYLRSRNGRLHIDLDSLIADGLGHLIKGVKETRYGQVVEFYDAQTALVQMGRYHGLFTDNVNNSGELEVKVKEPVTVKLGRLAGLLEKAKGRRDAAADDAEGREQGDKNYHNPDREQRQ